MAPGREVRAAAASEVARLFFDRQLSKVEIGSRLGISRFRVARLIEQALDAELVKIEFRDIPAVDRALARAIEADRPETRLNDGKVGPDGAFWVGSMDKTAVATIWASCPTSLSLSEALLSTG